MTTFPGLRPARSDDLPQLQVIRQAAFEPIFAAFRRELGDELYELVQAPDDRAQPALLTSLLEADSGWEVSACESGGSLVGFIAFRMDPVRKVGEIGLNAVHPDQSGRGIGTYLYEFALARMTEAGMRAATVATGGDAGHAAARSAYRKAGFGAEIPSVWMCRLLG